MRDLAYQLVPETFGASALEGIVEGAGQLGTQRSSEASIDRVRATRAEHDEVLDGRATFPDEQDVLRIRAGLRRDLAPHSLRAERSRAARESEDEHDHKQAGRRPECLERV